METSEMTPPLAPEPVPIDREEGSRFYTPILFLVFNRPDTTRRVFEVIRQNRPVRLYIAADGPRVSHKGETERVGEVRKIVSQIDWPCEVKTLFRDCNLGCKRAVSGAIKWFFEQESEGIVLEDDCVPHEHFFLFCSELLERYRHDDRIGFISGTSLFDLQKDSFIFDNEDYVFSKYLSVWGWASWKRVWEDYDPEITSWPVDQYPILALTENMRMRSIHKKLFDSVYNGKIDTWDYQVSFMLWKNSRLAITPRFNLIENIGFDSDGTHTKSSVDPMVTLSRMSRNTLKFPLIAPRLMIRNRLYEQRLEALASRSIIQKLFERIISYVK